MRLLLLLLFATPTLQKLIAKCGSTNKIYKDSTFHISTHQLPSEPLPTTTPAPTRPSLIWKVNKKGWKWEPISKEQEEDEDDDLTITSLQQESIEETHAHIPFQNWGTGKLPPIYSILFLKEQSQEQESYPEEEPKHPDLFDLFTKGSQQRTRQKRELGEKRHCKIRFEASSSCSRLVHHITLGDTFKMSCADEYLNLVENSATSKSYCGLERLARTKAYDKSLEITYVGRGETLLEGYVTCGQ